MDADEEGQQAAATLEVLSIAYDDDCADGDDASEQLLFDAPSLTGLTQTVDVGTWESITYGMDTGDATIDVNDDILTMDVPSSVIEGIVTENYADAFPVQDASLAGDGSSVASNEINITSSPSAPGSLSSLEVDAPMLQFDVTVEEGRRKTYVFKNRSLFTKMNSDVFFVVRCPVPPPPKSFIRICAVYSLNVFANEPVRRCPKHRLHSLDRAEHFIVVNSNAAEHVTEQGEDEESPRSYVIVPFDALPANKCLSLQFRCYSSCRDGINRRAVVLCFSLENGNRLLGHSEMHLKVCSVPNQAANVCATDRPRGRQALIKFKPLAADVVTVSTKKASQCAWEDDDASYSLEIRGRHLYRLVCSLVSSYETNRSHLKGTNQSGNRLIASDATGSLSANTPLDSWLNGLDLSKYTHLFGAKSQYVIADLDGIINKKYLLSLGIEEMDATKMLDSYFGWFNIFNARRMNSYLSLEPSTVRMQRTCINGTYRAPNASK